MSIERNKKRIKKGKKACDDTSTSWDDDDVVDDDDVDLCPLDAPWARRGTNGCDTPGSP